MWRFSSEERSFITRFHGRARMGGGSWELRPSSEWTLKRNKAQEGPDRVRIGNGAAKITDPTTEQGPEADATVCDHTSIDPATGRCHGGPAGGTPTAGGQRPR
jgi:hypothetical protein